MRKGKKGTRSPTGLSHRLKFGYMEAAENESPRLAVPVTVTSYLQIPSSQLSISYPSLTLGPKGTGEEQSKALHHRLKTPAISHISDTPGLCCVGTGRYPSSPHSCLSLPFLVRACLPENPTTVVPRPSQRRRRASDHPHISMTTTALDSRYPMERKQVNFTVNVHERYETGDVPSG